MKEKILNILSWVILIPTIPFYVVKITIYYIKKRKNGEDPDKIYKDAKKDLIK